jgi:hypothetical protein
MTRAAFDIHFMASAACVAGVLGFLMAALAMPALAASETTHTYPVTVTISVDRTGHRITGGVDSEAPAQFCEQAAVRLRQVMRGKDRVIARIRPNELGEWSFRSKPKLRGKRLYAETSEYHLPSRPVVCLAGRSRTVTAP